MKALLTAILCLWVSSLSWAADDANPHGEISLACQQCHSTEGWTALRPVLNFDHAKTKFPLIGRHVQVQCLECHTSLKFAETGTQCVDCHLDIHHGQFGNGCATCHTPASWQATEKMEERHQQTRFPLLGVHANVSCQSCHADGQYVTLPLNCKGCHLPTYRETKNPDHAMAGFSLECMQCHAITATAWKGATYQHPSSFPLTGGHAIESCNRCHEAAYTTVSSECYSCHAADFIATTNPAHEAGQFPHNCAECHNTSGWRPASFDHNLFSFALTGAHVSVNCASCHVGGQYTGISSACWSCHEAGYQASTNPDHETLQLPQDCAQCHTTQEWQPAAFDHNLTPYPLTGAHLSLACSQCHTAEQFAGTPEDCWSCHQAGYAAADNPNHAENQLSHACEECHATNAWQPSTFSHNATHFPLTGAHQTVACIQCHANGSYALTAMECFACHQPDYAATQNPNHAVGNYSHDCATCHTTDAWNPASFDHNLSQFPLTGAHVNVNCLACHVNGQYTGTPMECVTCHATDYSEAEEPNHAQNQLPHACESCHTTTAWSPSTFNHDNTPFPLTGAHVAANCAQCHVGGQFHSTPTDCWSCHEANYAATVNPDHEQLQLSHGCATCHATAAWAPAQFDHNLSGFPLTGAHVSVSCTQCHANGQYPGTPTDCWSCHQAGYQEADNHAQNQFPHECLQCHTTNGWEPSTFNHNNTNFPLTGAHVNVNCLACHVNGQYQNLTTDCWSCHQSNYQGVADPNHVTGNYGHECASCHTTAAWQPANFDHNLSDFPLTGAHVSLACAQCHTNGQFNGTPQECWSCHQINYNESDNPNHAELQLPHACEQCHTTAGWASAQFDHSLSTFPLTGAHVYAACAQCHVNGQFNNTPTECFACHAADYEQAAEPNHTANQLPHACQECHTTTQWTPSIFSHNATGFPLTGAHVSATCAACHVNGQFPGTPSDCYACHQSNFEGVSDPNHVADNFSHTCTQCHTTTAWTPATYDHSLSQFPLTGAHVSLACAQCHASGQFDNLATACWSCHQTNYNGTTNPNHAAGNFNHDCAQCHTTQAWAPAQYDHNLSDFPLTGAHVSVSCTQCHVNGQFNGTPADCWSCHQSNYQTANNPNHAAGQFPHECAECHSTGAWEPSTFNHAQTPFPLIGAHISVACAACHINGQFAGTPTACWSCHQSDYQGVTDPNHVTGQYSHLCQSCHTMNGWSPATFNHNLSDFPLTGAHVSTSCTQCHINGQYNNTPTDCWSCHQAAYNSAMGPNHAVNQLPHACQECHNTTAWEPSTFNHNSVGFPLTGAHITASCAQCHVNGQYGGNPTQCYACHTQDYQGATNPNHVAGQFSHRCNQCHTTSGWAPASFDHNLSDFPLQGAHVSVNCLACHIGGQYTGTPTACYACHQADYQGVQNPNHVTGGYDHSCTMCHTVNGWTPATFNHNLSDFPLTGAHIGVSCTQCHTNGQYDGTPTACYACHQPDYNSAQDPNHVQNQLPHGCQQCHTTAQWSPSTFNHNGTGFPLTGAHVAANCAQCHTNGQYQGGTPTDCWSCHQSDYGSATNPNHVTNQFPHACTECHSTSAWQPSTFNHNNTPFPLVGAHISVQCAQCHVNGQYQNTPADCYSCHQQDYQNTNDPNHQAAGFSHSCLQCHNMNSWDGGTFNHNNTDFPLTGAHVSVNCASCHASGQYQNLPSDCYSCHQANYQAVTDPNHVAGNYSHACAQCHTTIAWTPATFNHNLSQFPLTGAHISVACAQCHANGQYDNTPTQCYACHQSDYEDVQNPNHVAGQFSHTCNTCHTTPAWQPATFNHNLTDFPLTGAHVSAACNACHINGQFNGTPTACWSCHQADYNSANSPGHAANQLPHGCQQCHNTTGWSPSTFNHSGTSFPLTGAHVSASCGACHANGQYQGGTPTDCWSCHQTNYNAATDPSHAANQLPHACQQCHSTSHWDPSTFNHSSTSFPLAGAHVSVNCAQCHTNGQYQGGTPTQCYSCHQADYQGVTDPNHVTNQFSHDCLQCHSVNAWNPATFNHNLTDFPLTGAHVNATCAQCHVNGQYQGTPMACYSCHQADYQGALSPNHVQGQFSHTCSQCHTTTAWQPSTFNHNNTDFPLLGAHVSVSCAQCHINGQYNGTPTDCWSCHQQDYLDTNDPNHQAAGFSHLCLQCHTMNGWEGGTFNHNNTDFPLTGAHVSVNCASCHVNNQYNGTPTACFFCHQADYNGATNPNHPAAGFPTTCQTCHNTVNWNQAQFNHAQWFPIYSGSHQGEWDQCSDCHTNPNNYTVFSCIICHEHSNQQEVNQDHQGVQGYSYNSQACYQCHPTGNHSPAPGPPGDTPR